MPDLSRTALRNVRVFDGHRLGEPRTVVIDGAVIGDDPAGARELDAGGATLLPGLIDAHVHLHGPQDLDALAAWGVTTGLDMACWPAERVAELRTATAGAADFRTAGLPAIGPGGIHARMPSMPKDAIILTPQDARRHVEKRVSEGVDYIKGVAEAPGQGGPPAEALAALVAAAREHGLKTVIHADSPGAFALAVATGAEVITHLPLVGTIREEDAAAMRVAGHVAVPTITMMEAILASGFLGGDTSIDHLIASVATLRRAGAEIVAGTDANNEPGAPVQVRHGESLHHEFELMAQAGISPVEILRSATVVPARVFGLDDRGVIKPGMRADLLLIDGDPTTDISATRAVCAVWCAGTEITAPAEGAAPWSPRPASATRSG
jgi:imidazolonepropionase-like amidohydrolase